MSRFAPLILVISAFALWWAISSLESVPAYILPPPIAVFKEFADDWMGMLVHFAWTLAEALGGLVCATLLGFAVSSILFLVPPLEQAFMPLIVGFKAIPLVALAPLFLLWFGSGFLAKCLMATAICFFPVVVGLVKGFRACSDDEILFLRDLRLSLPQELFRFRIWKSVPFFLAGLRIASVLAVVGAIVGEFTGARVGLGYVVTVAAVRIDTPLLFVGIFLSSFCGFLLYGLALIVEKSMLAQLRLDPIE